jgi:acetyltransferase-like isoleucine patch superfamily enzyme
MKFSNISLGLNVEIDPSTSFNNLIIGERVKIGKRCSVYGGPENLLEIGAHSYIGMNCIINGYANKIIVGEHVSIGQNVNIMSDSGPNASIKMQKLFPIVNGPVEIGNHSWIGASAIIMPNVTLGDFCVVAANSFVNCSFPAFSIIGGSPARLIRRFTEDEINSIQSNDQIP